MNNFLKLSELTKLIANAIDDNFNDFYYVVAEILQINTNISGHVYLELIEKDNDFNEVIARVKAIIWKSRVKDIRARFEKATGQWISSGMTILTKVQVTYHQVFGLSLIIHDIDPAYTIGEYELLRKQTIEQLKKDGVFEMNKRLPFPILPKSFAIISSPSAAGLRDFIHHLSNNYYGYKYDYDIYYATMQGDETVASVIDALEKIYEKLDKYQFVVIVRGGGSKHDLMAFDNYQLCLHLAQFPLPIVTGIGHTHDVSIADLVANKSVKTPTAAADLIINLTFDFENRLSAKLTKIIDLSKKMIFEEAKKLDSYQFLIKSALNSYFFKQENKIFNQKLRLKNAVTLYHQSQINKFLYKKQIIANGLLKYIDKSNNLLSSKLQILYFKAHNIISKCENLLVQKDAKIKQLDPQELLKKGFVLVSKEQKRVYSASELKSGDIIKLLFQDGIVKSKVE